MAFELALLLGGGLTVKELMTKMSALEFAEWDALFRLKAEEREKGQQHYAALRDMGY